MSDPFIGEIRAYPYVFTPYNWLLCAGQDLDIQQYPALFTVIGTFYGGDGVRTFGLPNLSGRAPIGQGQGVGLTDYPIGAPAGEATVALVLSELPPHNHSVSTLVVPTTEVAYLKPAPTANTSWPSRYYDISTPSKPEVYEAYNPKVPNPVTTPTHPTTPVDMNLSALGVSGTAGATHDNHQPYLALRFFIAPYGIFPSRS